MTFLLFFSIGDHWAVLDPDSQSQFGSISTELIYSGSRYETLTRTVEYLTIFREYLTIFVRNIAVLPLLVAIQHSLCWQSMIKRMICSWSAFSNRLESRNRILSSTLSIQKPRWARFDTLLANWSLKKLTFLLRYSEPGRALTFLCIPEPPGWYCERLLLLMPMDGEKYS